MRWQRWFSLALTLTIAGLAIRPVQAQTFSVLHTFSPLRSGASPQLAPVADGAGNLYGATYYGGDLTCDAPLGCGTVFKLDKQGRERVLYRFAGGTDGVGPNSPLVRDSTGNLYGVTIFGGDTVCQCGTVFRVDLNGAETVLYRFTGGDGIYPSGQLVLDGADNIYGATSEGGDFACPEQGSTHGCGTVYRLDAAGNKRVLHTFAGGADGAFPTGLVNDSVGNLYGTSFGDGDPKCVVPNDCGTVFKVDKNGHLSTLHDFLGGTDGVNPYGLVVDALGNIYGTTINGGDLTCNSGSGCGTIFEIDTTGNKTVLHNFTGLDGMFPDASPVLDSAGNLYGVIGFGGACCGTVFMLNAAGQETVLYSFSGGADGSTPVGLVRSPAGNIYGFAVYGGDVTCDAPYGCGTVFEVSP